MQAQELLEDVERNGKHWGATQGSQDGRTLQGAPWKASEYRGRREREDPAGSILESLRAQGQTRACCCLPGRGPGLLGSRTMLGRGCRAKPGQLRGRLFPV